MLSTARKGRTATNMESEMGRLYSFLSWLQAVQPSRLSRNGFYYSGFNNKVVCHKCGVEVEGWTTVDEVLDKHQQESPFCAQAASEGDPNFTAGTGTELATPVNCRPKGGDEDDGTVQTSSPAPTVAGLAGAYHQTARQKPTAVIIDRSNPDFNLLRSESMRLETFHDWPSTAARVVDPRDLVKAGLFYSGHSDRVQCAFCRGFLRNWVRGDKPIDEHRKHFPYCPFVQTLDRMKLPTTVNSSVNSSEIPRHKASCYRIEKNVNS